MARAPRKPQLLPALSLPKPGPQDAQDQNSFALSAVISGAQVTDTAISALLSDQPGLFVNNLRSATHR